MENFIEVRNVTKAFDRHVALSDVSLTMRRGRVFGLLGPNGAGKTTLIRILNRITAPDKGEVIFDGRQMQPADVARIGYLPEERGLYRKMKVGEQAVYLARLKGLTRREAETRLKEWFRKFGIMPWWNRKLEELSKGMAQKVQFIITVLHEPDLLIFDEPFSGFDPVNAEQLKQEILQLKEKGHTIIFSTHNMASVEEICDDIALINHSEVVLKGDMRQIKEAHRTGLYELQTPDVLSVEPDSPFDIVRQEERAGIHSYLLKAHGDATGNQLVGYLAGKVEVRAFAEQIPSMNDIFLQLIGKDAQWADEQIENRQQSKAEESVNPSSNLYPPRNHEQNIDNHRARVSQAHSEEEFHRAHHRLATHHGRAHLCAALALVDRERRAAARGRHRSLGTILQGAEGDGDLPLHAGAKSQQRDA